MQTRSERGIFKPKSILFLDTSIVDLEPTSYTQASTDPKWREAIVEEFNAFITNKTWELVLSQPRQSLVHC